MAEDIIYKPRELYETQLKKQFHDEAEKYYEELAVKGNLDKGTNKVHVEKYDKENAKLNAVDKNRSSKRTKKGLLIALSVILIIGAIVLIVVGVLQVSKNGGLGGGLIGGGAAVIVGGILILVFPVRSFSKKIKELDNEYAKQETVVKKALSDCYADMAGLNSLLDWNIPAKIVKNVTPILQIDDFYTNERAAMLKENYGLWDDDNPDSSTIGVLSGEIQGNPFILQRSLVRRMVPKVYTGSIVITWVTYSTDSNGRRVAHHHSQTLTATHTEPAPVYENVTALIYGNEAAPKLSFFREPYHADKLSEKERIKEVQKGGKELRKLAESSLKKGNSHPFTPMGNDEFDWFFRAFDRDNEVEFRLLFTPLAQTNMLDLIENKEPFGDDFYFKKVKKINIIQTAHSQSFPYFTDPDYFIHYSFEAGKERMVSYCDAFIKNFYYDFAPLMSIPLYQMHKSHEFIYRDDNVRNYPIFEQEVMANYLGDFNFRPKNAAVDLPVILKAVSSSKRGVQDEVKIHGSSFIKIPRVTLVPMHGGDGRIHDVPVHWIEYDPIAEDNYFRMFHANASKAEFDSNGKEVAGAKYQRGYIASMMKGKDDGQFTKIESIFNKK